MKAAVLHGPDDLRVEEVPTPRAGPGEVVVRVRANGICGTDLRVVGGTKTRGVVLPRIIGHELAGEVAEVGAGVTAVRVGDRVSVAPIHHCHRCAYCLNDRENVCLNRTALGYEYDGGLAEYVLVPAASVAEGNLVRVPETLSFEEAALVEPVACCVNGNELSRVRLGDRVLILGGGPIGLIHLQLARLAGASRVIVSEPTPHRRAVASRLGADVALDPTTDDLLAIVRDLTDGLGADATILAFGAPELVDLALNATRKGGTVNLFAGFPGAGEATFSANTVHYHELIVTGTSSYKRAHFQTAADLIATGKVNVRDLITTIAPLDQVVEALAAVRRGAGLKTVIRI